MKPINPDDIAEPYRFKVEMGILPFDDFLFAIRQAFNAGTLRHGEEVASIRAEFSRELAAKQAVIDQLLARSSTPCELNTKGNE